MCCTFVKEGSSNFMALLRLTTIRWCFSTFALLGGGGNFAPWLFEDNSKTKRSSQSKLKIVFQINFTFCVFFCLGNIRSRHQVESRDLTSKKV